MTLDHASNMVDRFYAYINERENIRLRRLNEDPWPWTEDVALQTYRFTNVRREDDRTTLELSHIYRENRNAPHEQALLNATIYRCVGTSEFARALGWQKSYEPNDIINLVRERRDEGLPTFTGAYIVTNQGLRYPKEWVVARVHVQGIWEKRKELIAEARNHKSYERFHGLMSQINGFGGTGFMAKEVCLDLMLTPLLEDATDRDTWSPTGPGAMRGLNWIHGRAPQKPIKQGQALDEMRELLELAPQHTILPLRVTDIQWNLCEFGKLCSIRTGGRGKRRYRVQ